MMKDKTNKKEELLEEGRNNDWLLHQYLVTQLEKMDAKLTQIDDKITKQQIGLISVSNSLQTQKNKIKQMQTKMDPLSSHVSKQQGAMILLGVLFTVAGLGIAFYKI